MVGVLKEVSAAAEHLFDPPAVLCEYPASPGLLEEDGLARPVVDVQELEMTIGELRGDQVDEDVELFRNVLGRSPYAPATRPTTFPGL